MKRKFEISCFNEVYNLFGKEKGKEISNKASVKTFNVLKKHKYHNICNFLISYKNQLVRHFKYKCRELAF